MRHARVIVPLLLLLVPRLWSQPRLIVVLRVDDVMSRNTTILPRSIVPFEQAVESRGGKVTWVTIPHRLIESTNADGRITGELVASLGRGHEVAQHGYNHICTRCASSGHEFYCATQGSPFTLAEQLSMVDDGLKILQDSLHVRPTTFVSPGHVEDTTTYRALASRGFTVLSTTKVATKQDVLPGLYNLAHHGEYTWALTPAGYRAAVDSALAHVRSKGERDGYFALLFHDYFIREGYEGGIVVRWVGEVLDSLKRRYGTGVEFLTLGTAAEYLQRATAVVQSAPTRPSRLELLPNYPNPFNPATTIRYGLSERSVVSLAVFNALGQELAVLVQGEMEAGYHEVRFTASGLSSGVYFYRLRVGDQIRTQQLLLMK